MSLSGSTVFEVRTTGSDTNGGGYVSGGTDWSQQNAAQYAVVDGVTAGTTTITSATANFGTDVVGNIIYVQGGTGSVVAGWYQIASRTNATTIVVDRSTGLTAGTGVTLNIGGAFASTVNLPTLMTVNGMVAWIKATGTYSPTGNMIDLTAAHVTVSGYTTTRGDGGVATIDATGMTAGQNTIKISDHSLLEGLSVSNSKGIAFVGINQSFCNKCKATSSTGNSFDGFRTCFNCWAVSAGSVGFNNITNCVGCVSKSSVSHGFSNAQGASCIYCIADTSGSSGTAHGFAINESCVLTNCVAYNSRNNGIAGNNKSCITGCISYGSGQGGSGFGFSSIASAVEQGAFIGNLAGNNVSGNVDGNFNSVFCTTPINLTGNPFNSPSTGDFSTNNTAGAGATVRASGWPGTMQAGSVGYADGGAVQHQDTGGGAAGMLYIPSLEGI